MKFKIHSCNDKRFFWVVIHDNQDDFEKGATKYNTISGSDNDYQYQEIKGLFHPYQKYQIKGKTDLINRFSNDIGIIRLIKTKTQPHVVYHEVLHAAIWLYRINHRGKFSLGSGVTEKEEEFCHLYDQLLSNMVSKLYELNFWG